MDRRKMKLFEQIEGKLIVSCQALADEPLYGSEIMGKMALAAYLGGASGIRANTVSDILAIKKQVPLPVIGIIKEVYGSEPVFITPTLTEIDALAGCGCEIIATDATDRLRPGGKTLAEFYGDIRARYPEQIFMADVSTYEEGIAAWQLGFDIVATTLSGYTDYTKETTLPDFGLIRKLKAEIDVPIIAEGGIHSPGELRAVLEAGAFAAVVGGAITRPLEITRRFVEVL